MLLLAEALLTAVLVLFAKYALIKEKTDILKGIICVAVPTVAASVAGLFFSFNDSQVYALALAVCVVAGIIAQKENTRILLYCTAVVHTLMCSGSFFLFAVKGEYRIVAAQIFCIFVLACVAFLPVKLFSTKAVESELVKSIYFSIILVLAVVLFAGILGQTAENIIFGVLLLFFLCELKRHIDRVEIERQNKCQIEQYQDNLSQMYDMMRLFRHNYKNLIIGVKGCLREKNYGEMEQLLESIETGTDDANFKQQMAVVSQLEDASIKWLLIAKLSAAQKYGINTSLVVSKQIDFGSMKKSEFNVVLGNLLDNAIESASESQNKLLKIAIFNKNGDTIVSVKNTYGKKPLLGKIFDKGYSEKQGHSGLGLYGVKKIVDSYPNVLLDIRIMNEHFTVDLNISGASPEKKREDL